MLTNNNFMDGEMKKSFSGSFTFKTPFYDYSVELPNSSLIDLKIALSCATKAKEHVEKLSFEERKAILERTVEAYTVSDEELDHLVKTTGMPKKYVKERVNFGKLVLKSIPDIVASRYGHEFGTITRPIFKMNGSVFLTGYESHRAVNGLISVFMPPNDPAEVPFILGHIVMYGGTAVIKPSAAEPYFTLKIAELLTQSGYPNGALNVIQWDTNDESRKAVSHELVRSSSHRIIMGGKNTADSLLKITNDQGLCIEEQYSNGNNCIFSAGNSKAIVGPDADIEKVADMLVQGAYVWTNDCVSTKSVFVVGNEQKNKLLEAIKKKLQSKCLHFEDPLNINSEVGFAENAGKVIDCVRGLIDFKYAKLHHGELQHNNSRFKPFLIETTNLHSPLLQQEFPYTLTVVPTESLSQAIDFANEASSLLDDKMTMAISIFTKHDSLEKLYEHEPELVKKFLTLKCHLLMVNKPSIALNVFLRHQDTMLTEFLTRPISINN